MKQIRIYLLLVFGLLSMSLYAAPKHRHLTRAQDTIYWKAPNPTWRLEMGYDQSWLRRETLSFAYLHGGHVGFTADFLMPVKNLYVETGLSYSFQYGTSTQYASRPTEDAAFNLEGVNEKMMLHNFLIPVRVRYDIRLYKDLHLFFFGGPTFDLGVAFQNKIENTLTSTYDADDRNSSTLDLYNTYDPKSWSNLSTGTHGMYKEKAAIPFNFMMGVGGGLSWKRWSIQAGYDFGLNNISKATDKMNKWKWNAGFSYTFGK